MPHTIRFVFHAANKRSPAGWHDGASGSPVQIRATCKARVTKATPASGARQAQAALLMVQRRAMHFFEPQSFALQEPLDRIVFTPRRASSSLTRASHAKAEAGQIRAIC